MRGAKPSQSVAVHLIALDVDPIAGAHVGGLGVVERAQLVVVGAHVDAVDVLRGRDTAALERLVFNHIANQRAERRAGRLRSDLQFGRIDEILATGLHAYLTQFLDRVNDIGAGISRDFLVPA